MKWLKRSYKRDWLQRSPKLNTVSYCHELWEYPKYTLKKDAETIPRPQRTMEHYDVGVKLHCRFELVLSIGSEIIKLHANDNIDAFDALGDYIRKLGVIEDLLKRFLSDFKPHYDAGKNFVLKEFLNSSTGPSAVYTSMVAVGTSSTHDFFFDIASCTDKARLYEIKEKEFVSLITKLTKIIATAIADTEVTLEKYKDKF